MHDLRHTIRTAAVLAALTLSGAGGLARAADNLTWDPSTPVPLTIHGRGTRAAEVPITIGVPFADGALKKLDRVSVRNEKGEVIPCQRHVMARWVHSKNIKWVLVDFRARGLDKADTLPYSLRYEKAVRTRGPKKAAIKVAQNEGWLSVDTGKLRFVLKKRGCGLVHGVEVDHNGDGEYGADEAVMTVSGALPGPYLVRADGTVFRAAYDRDSKVTIEEEGSQRICIKVAHDYVSEEGDRLCRSFTRIHAYAGLVQLKLNHTFVFTVDMNDVQLSDIGVRFNMPATGVSFGQADGGMASMSVPGNLVQYEHDKYRLDFPDKSVKQGGGAPGWMNVENAGSRVTVGLRDFWQKYPNELSADKDGFAVHFWPAHNEEVKEPEIEYYKLKDLWFAHHGKVMDLKVPERYWSWKDDVHAKREFGNLRCSRVASAAGVARSFEIHLSLAPASAGPDSFVTAAAQRPPWCVVNPEYACNTLAYGQIAAQREDRFVGADKALERLFDKEMRCQKGLEDYGKWIYGNAHTSFGMGFKPDGSVYYAAPLGRVWRNTHHGGPRAPWMLYAHFGELKYLDWAIANTENMLDVVFCHERVPNIPVGSERSGKLYLEDTKFKGGMCDYKGYVPWNAGGRQGYNSLIDFMLYYYYNTGNKWGYEVMCEYAELYKSGKRGNPLPTHQDRYPGRGRSSSARISACVNIYRALGDELFLKSAKAHVSRLKYGMCFDGQMFKGRTAFAPGLVNYYELTKGPVITDMILKEADFLCDFNKIDEVGFVRGTEVGGQYFMRQGYHLDQLACAYRITGDEKYLRLAKGRLLLYAAAVIGDKGPEAPLAGGFTIGSQPSYYSYIPNQAPHVMRQLIKADKDNQLKPHYPEWRYMGGPDMKIIFKKDVSEPVSFLLHYHNSKPNGKVVFKRLEPDKGMRDPNTQKWMPLNVCKRPARNGTLNYDPNYNNMVPIDIPGVWMGECVIEFKDVSDDFFVWAPLRLRGKAEVKVVYTIPDVEKGFTPTVCSSMYFGVTKPRPQFEVVRAKGYACLAGPFVFATPEGRFVASKVAQGPAKASTVSLAVDEPLKAGSLVCMLTGAKYVQSTREQVKNEHPEQLVWVGKIKGLTSFFSATADEFFVPKAAGL